MRPAFRLLWSKPDDIHHNCHSHLSFRYATPDIRSRRHSRRRPFPIRFACGPNFCRARAQCGHEKSLGQVQGLQAGSSGPTHAGQPRAIQSPIQRAYLEVTDETGADVFPATQISHRAIPGPKGKGQILVRFFKPANAGNEPLPMVVYFHGGGFVIANLDVYAASCRAIANKAGVIVASVAYPLAPENPFPAAPEASYAATQYLTKNAKYLGADPDKVAVMGESAGGNLATVVCMMAKDRGGLMPKHQVLVYPYVMNSLKLSDSTLYRRYPSYQINRDAIPLGKAAGQWFWKYYPGVNAKGLPLRYQEPIKASVSQVRGLPPATVITAEIDVLQSEGNDYATKLKAAGVPVRYKYYKGVTHEFFGMGGTVPQADDAQNFVASGLKSAFGMM